MRAQAKRLESLEMASGLGGGWDITKPCHSIILSEDTPYTDALTAYMNANPEKRVRGDDNVIWIQICSPKFDETGKMITRKPQTVEDVQQGGPSLAQVLKQLEAA